MRTSKVTPHKEEHHSLINYLIRAGIRPGSFAYFLKEFIEREPKEGSSAGSLLLNDIMKVQAELILFNLNH